jgi:hypothetical protein
MNGGQGAKGGISVQYGAGEGGVTYLPAPPKTAGAAQRRGVKGAAALTLHDSGANPICAQTGGRAQTGG